jgi:hypothetical protein
MRESEISLSRDDFGRLVLIDPDGIRHEGVTAIRAFPLSSPDRGIALCDERGQEVFWIDELAALTPEARSRIEREITSGEFLPAILKIYKITSDSTPCEFDVETDRGRTKFTLDSDESIRKISLHRMIVTDARGVRYHVPDLNKLDTASRRAFERHL